MTPLPAPQSQATRDPPSATRLCPRCRTALAAFHRSPVFRCATCRGAWFSPPALERLSHTPFTGVLATFAPVNPQEAALACPDCAAPTLELVGKERFQLHRCNRQGGIWLDGTGLARLAQEVTPRWRHFVADSVGHGFGKVLVGLLDEA